MMRSVTCLLAIFAVCAACDSSGGTDDGAGATGAGNNGSGGAGNNGSGGAGLGGSVDACTVFPADNPWNADISGFPVHANSDNFIDSIGRNDTMHPDFGTTWENAPIGIPYAVVDDAQAMVPINFVAYGDESDPGPYPIPSNALVEGGPDGDGDRHVLVVESASCVLYELYRAFSVNGGESWDADSGAVWDLKINATRPDRWTSADAAGLPIFPGLVRYDEVVEKGVINHALRFTVSHRTYPPWVCGCA